MDYNDIPDNPKPRLIRLQIGGDETLALLVGRIKGAEAFHVRYKFNGRLVWDQRPPKDCHPLQGDDDGSDSKEVLLAGVV